MMSQQSLHLGHVSDTDPPDIEVIKAYPKAYGFLQVAMELWRLAGRTDRASAIDDVIASAVSYEPRRLERAQIEELRGLLDGLEQALAGTLTDEEYLLSEAKVEELRGRTETLDFNESYGRNAREAVQEALIYVDHLRTIADTALAAGACILFEARVMNPQVRERLGELLRRHGPASDGGGEAHPGESGSMLSYGLTQAPPLFGLPPSWARSFADAGDAPRSRSTSAIRRSSAGAGASRRMNSSRSCRTPMAMPRSSRCRRSLATTPIPMFATTRPPPCEDWPWVSD